jgi:hypothetical protein
MIGSKAIPLLRGGNEADGVDKMKELWETVPTRGCHVVTGVQQVKTPTIFAQEKEPTSDK